MKQYLDLLKSVLETGQLEHNRTGVDTLTVPGAMLKFDLREGFPAVTTKKLAFKQVVGELIGFLRGSTSLTEFQQLGCTVWNANATAPAWQNNPYCRGSDDLGAIYGSQWRNYGGRGWDQIENALAMVRHQPSSRRILVNAWHPGQLDMACLPPCHILFQLLPRSDGTLHMTMYQRSCDLFLGVPFNIASYAMLLELFARWSGREAATLTMFLADAHIYANHVSQVKLQLLREPLSLPQLVIEEYCSTQQLLGCTVNELIDALTPDMFELDGYRHLPAIRAPMAV
jgi:thymidylate synthase